MATKQQEREALAKIRKIVDALGEDSYIGASFTGCFELAEENIEMDFACNLQDRADAAEREAAALKAQLADTQKKLEAAQQLSKAYLAELDRELAWKPSTGTGTNMDQTRYEALASAGRQMTDQEAKEFIADECGFSVDKITILHEVSTYEVNKYHRLRVAAKYDRSPVYESTDWNYIRFDCASFMYELVNGELRFYYC